MVENNEIERVGLPPKTIYKIKVASIQKLKSSVQISISKQAFLQENFIAITEIGQPLEGLGAFDYWCEKRKLPLEKTIDEFILTKDKYNRYIDKKRINFRIRKTK